MQFVSFFVYCLKSFEQCIDELFSLLQDKGREAVVLFVGCENRAARVYRRVGFQGLDTIVDGSVDNVNRWLEVGFDRNKVTLGHW
jgi:ribosomal protein S18 acetylase RimI-like enzyme